MMKRILGIDPGSRVTGFGVIEVVAQRVSYIASGCIRTAGEDFPGRLRVIYEGVCEVIATYQPHEAAVENVFMQRNAAAALKLGQARGAAICALVNHELLVHEYTPTQIKQAVVGRGHADKAQIQHMVPALLGLSAVLQADAADALATAICHGHHNQRLVALAGGLS